MKDKTINVLKIFGLGFLEPLIKIKEKPEKQLKIFFKMTIVPILAFILFLVLWNWGATSIQESQDEKNAAVIYKTLYHQSKKAGKSPESAEKIAQEAVAAHWDVIYKKKYKDRIYDDVEAQLNAFIKKKREQTDAKQGIELDFTTYEAIEALPSLMRQSLKIDREKGIAVSDDKTYIIIAERDLNILPEKYHEGKVEGHPVKLNITDLQDMLTTSEFSYFYEMEFLPRPKDVLKKWKLLVHEHRNERKKEAEFYADQAAKIAKIQGSKLSPEEKQAQITALEANTYPGYPTFFDQILTSIETVLAALLLAALIAVPLGILMGLSPVGRAALNPIVQLFKPISPVVWFLLVAMVVNAVIDTETAMVPKSFTISYISVALCAMWATLVNTSMGVSSVSQDFINVADVLKLKGMQRVFKVILPSAVPMIFTGLRITVTTAWMVLIAVELLAQNPGLGKFVWDEFNNGNSNSNAKILVAAIVIGVIGFFLDRIMLIIQKSASFDKKGVA